MVELDVASFERTGPLFAPLNAYQPFCAAVLAGIHPGRVLVDDADEPRTAFLSHSDAWCYLAGAPDNEAFNRALNRVLFERQLVGPDVPILLFTCHPQEWASHLPAIFAPRQPVPANRRHYVGRTLHFDWRAQVPAGFLLRPLDDGLLQQPGLTIPEEVSETLARWRTIAHPDFQDLGLVAIHGDEIAAWATIDAVVDGTGDIGFFVMPAYRRRGLATVLAAAAIDRALAQGLSLVSWTCAEDNAGSIRIAEKLGLERCSDYRMYCLCFNEADELVQLAYSSLLAGEYQRTVELYERFFALAGRPPAWAHHDLARAYAALGDTGQALLHLRAAVDDGWAAAEETAKCPEFGALRGLPQWAGLLARMRRAGH
jgi:RimJ/RimL family protein N-acetyltransferase